MTVSNLHASAVLLRGRGVLVRGPSGSGKTRLALRLAAEPDGILVSDDQVFLRVEEGRLLAEAPPSIRGLTEIRGFGIATVAFAPFCAIDLVVRLLPATEAPRMREDGDREILEGLSIPCLRLAERDAEGAALAVKAFLFGSPF